jgi:PEP-CTERM motif
MYMLPISDERPHSGPALRPRNAASHDIHFKYRSFQVKTILKALSLAAIIAASAPLALASSITIESYGANISSGTNANTSTPNTAPADAGNTVMTYAGGTTYDIPTVAPWASLGGNSSWISFNPGTWVGGPVDDGGTITVLADDTTSVMLNGVVIAPQAPAVPATNCTQGQPNCVFAATYNLSGFVNGTNTLTFVVAQDFGSATGLDFLGTVTGTNSNAGTTPEPSSLFLLGSGLLTVVGVARRKLKA